MIQLCYFTEGSPSLHASGRLERVGHLPREIGGNMNFWTTRDGRVIHLLEPRQLGRASMDARGRDSERCRRPWLSAAWGMPQALDFPSERPHAPKNNEREKRLPAEPRQPGRAWFLRGGQWSGALSPAPGWVRE